MSNDFGVIGNGTLLAKVGTDGVMSEAYFPSIGFFRHIIQSRFGIYHPAEGHLSWLNTPEWEPDQRYLDETNVLETRGKRGNLRASVFDFVHPELSCVIRTLEVRNVGDTPVEISLVHAEASSVADHKGEFGNNVTYYNRLRNHFVCYRGHPWDNAVEAQIVWLVAAEPPADSYQCGASYQDAGASMDAFFDATDGALQENRYVFGFPNGTTSGFLWRRHLEPGAATSVSVRMVPGTDLFDAEDSLAAVGARHPEQLYGETVTYWRNWLERGKRTAPSLGDARLERLYLRSLLLLKLLQDRRYGSLIAAPTLEPDYRYCWPRDAVYLAWALDRGGYHEEAAHFYRWCRRTQMFDGLWYQNHYTDGRRHWAGIQVDQVATILWGAWQHFLLTREREFLVEMWPTLRRAADYLISRRHPEHGLVYSEQDLWEETGGYLTYTQASCVAGWEAAAKAAHEVGREPDAIRWAEAAAALRCEIDAQLVQEEVFVGEREPRRHFHMRPDYLMDISNVGLSVPFDVIPPQRTEMMNTVARIEREADYPIGGIGRYTGDLFMGGNPWSLSGLWLAMYYAEIGDVAGVRRHLNWCLKHAMAHDFLPEQSHRQTALRTSAAPLAWSHAWVVILLQSLGKLRSQAGTFPSD